LRLLMRCSFVIAWDACARSLRPSCVSRRHAICGSGSIARRERLRWPRLPRASASTARAKSSRPSFDPPWTRWATLSRAARRNASSAGCA